MIQSSRANKVNFNTQSIAINFHDYGLDSP
ncbi:hypothetical protein SAMN05216237_1217 [Pseudomonas yamanorum]|nr:hypothetical protein SAMN05216237_1217 [Pseudomonas yamanorum]